jgi:hypothetical protein
MSQTDKKLELLRTLSLLDPDRLTKDDFVKSFRGVIDAFKQREDKFATDFANLHTTLTNRAKQLEDGNATDLTAWKKEATQLRDSVAASLTASINAKLQEVDAKLATIKNGDDADEERVTQAVLDRMPTPFDPDSAEDIRNKLELLTGDERLDPKAILGLVERLDALEKKAGEKAEFIGGGIIGRNYIQFYDLSSLLDGSTTTFNTPAMWKLFDVKLSSVPVLRETVDYTWTPTTLTLVGRNAATELAVGQSLIITFVA